jgi:hypothetical protein
LKQSARLGPDLFPDAAIDPVLILVGSDEFCALILQVCAELASRRPDLGARLCKTALDNIEKGLHPELAASVLVALGYAVAFPLDGACIERLLLSQDHYLPIGGWEDVLFAHYRAFRYEQIVLETAANALPEEPRHESFRGGLRQLAMVAAGNASLRVGNTAAAEACFVQGKSRA